MATTMPPDQPAPPGFFWIDTRLGTAALRARAASNNSHPQAIFKFHRPSSLDYRARHRLLVQVHTVFDTHFSLWKCLRGKSVGTCTPNFEKCGCWSTHNTHSTHTLTESMQLFQHWQMWSKLISLQPNKIKRTYKRKCKHMDNPQRVC